MSTNDFQLDELLANLSSLKPENLVGIPPVHLEWALGQFVLSFGQQLPVHQAMPVVDPRDKRISRFGRRYLPFAMASDFPGVGDYEVNTLAVATACGILHSRFLDLVIDEPSHTSPTITYAIPHLYLQFCRLLSLLFPADSVFWKEVDRLTALTSRAGLTEKRKHNKRVEPYSWEEFQQTSHDKMALAQINPVALALLNGTPEILPTFQECWKAISLAVIVNDDVLDWQEDYDRGNYTYLLSQILLSSPLDTEVAAGQFPTRFEVGVGLFASDVVEELYLRASNALQHAHELASNQRCFGLANLIYETTEWMRERRAEVTVRKLLQLFRPSVKTEPSDQEV